MARIRLSFQIPISVIPHFVNRHRTVFIMDTKFGRKRSERTSEAQDTVHSIRSHIISGKNVPRRKSHHQIFRFQISRLPRSVTRFICRDRIAVTDMEVVKKLLMKFRFFRLLGYGLVFSLPCLIGIIAAILFYGHSGGTDNTLSEIYDLQDALIVAQYLNIFLRTCDIVKMANMAQLVNVIAPMRVDNDKLWKQTTYYPLYLFANNCRGKALDIYIKSPAYSTDKYKEVPYLDVSSTYEPSRNEVVINVVNRNKDKAITADILSQTGSFDKKATANIVSGANTNITNSVNEQNVDIKKEEIKTSGEKITYSFAPRSFTQIIVKVK